MKTIKASVAIKSADIILKQKGVCVSPIYVSCCDCHLYAVRCGSYDDNVFKSKVKLLNKLRGK